MNAATIQLTRDHHPDREHNTHASRQEKQSVSNLMDPNPQQPTHQASSCSSIDEFHRRVLSASKLGNPTPKPFKSSRAQSQEGPATLRPEHQNPTFGVRCAMATPAVVGSPRARAPGAIMHNQYNSPMSLYSMDTIRKTIDAHTEMVAPGVKGINFMRDEQPVNKQSDVFKLIKELEAQRSTQSNDHSSSMVNGSGQQVHRGSPSVSSDASSSSTLRTPTSQGGDCRTLTSNQPFHRGRQARHQQLPICSECGLTIEGAYARVAGNSIHANCFNCSTCGSSLKNTGYFTINDKLYCELHAQQMAKVLKLCPEQIATAAANTKTSEPCVDALARAPSAAPNLRAPPPAPIQPPWQPRAPGSRQQQQQQQQSVSNGNSAKTLTSAATYNSDPAMASRVPVCVNCETRVQGTYILAGKSTWCKPCSQSSLICNSCRKSLLDVGFIEEDANIATNHGAQTSLSETMNCKSRYYCEHCYDSYFAPVCSSCHTKVNGDCLSAMDKQWHPQCFVCGHCNSPIGNAPFYIEDGVPYCKSDWALLFTTKCHRCSKPIEAGDKWIEAMKRSYHSSCFTCATCHMSLEGSVFYCKAGKPYCKLHAL